MAATSLVANSIVGTLAATANVKGDTFIPSVGFKETRDLVNSNQKIAKEVEETDNVVLATN